MLLLSCFSLVRLWDPTDSSPPGSAVPGIFQARTLEWAAISFSSAWKWNVKVKSLSHVLLFSTPWTAADHAPPSMGFSRQEYWSGVPLPFLNYMLIPIINLTFNSRQGIVAQNEHFLFVSYPLWIKNEGSLRNHWETITHTSICIMGAPKGFPCGSVGKESTCNAGAPGSSPWVGKILWRRERLSIPVFWPGEFHGL